MRVARVRFPAKPFLSKEIKKGKEREGRKEGKGRALLAQSVERAAFNRKVVGSRPTGGVFLKGKEKKEKGKEYRDERGGKRGKVRGCIAQW